MSAKITSVRTMPDAPEVVELVIDGKYIYVWKKDLYRRNVIESELREKFGRLFTPKLPLDWECQVKRKLAEADIADQVEDLLFEITSPPFTPFALKSWLHLFAAARIAAMRLEMHAREVDYFARSGQPLSNDRLVLLGESLRAAIRTLPDDAQDLFERELAKRATNLIGEQIG